MKLALWDILAVERDSFIYIPENLNSYTLIFSFCKGCDANFGLCLSDNILFYEKLHLLNALDVLKFDFTRFLNNAGTLCLCSLGARHKFS